MRSFRNLLFIVQLGSILVVIPGLYAQDYEPVLCETPQSYKGPALHSEIGDEV